MPSDPLIRPVRLAEVPVVVALWEAFMADQNRYVRFVRRTRANRDLMATRFAQLVGHGQLWGYELDDELVGFVALSVNLPPVETFFASAAITDLYVAPAARGRGAGRALLERAIALAAERGVHAVSITVAAGNDAARALYRSAGFRPEKETLLLPLDRDLARFGPAAATD